MPGRFPGEATHLTRAPLGKRTLRNLEEFLKLLKDGMANLQKTPRLPTQNRAGIAANRGTGPAPALDDHQHDTLSGPPGEILLGQDAAEGSSAAFARADHTHDTRGLTRQIALRLVVRQ